MFSHIVRQCDIAVGGSVYGTIGGRIGNIQHIMVCAKYYSFVGLLNYVIVSWSFIYFIQNKYTDDFKNQYSYTEPTIIPDL